jgi:hypothetical protein
MKDGKKSSLVVVIIVNIWSQAIGVSAGILPEKTLTATLDSQRSPHKERPATTGAGVKITRVG